MDKPHKQVRTTHPIAIKSGQTRVHVRIPIPWHPDGGTVKCPKCETEFIVTQGFSTEWLLDTLVTQHKNQEAHPDFIPSDPTWTSIVDCDCGL